MAGCECQLATDNQLFVQANAVIGGVNTHHNQLAQLVRTAAPHVHVQCLDRLDRTRIMTGHISVLCTDQRELLATFEAAAVHLLATKRNSLVCVGVQEEDSVHEQNILTESVAGQSTPTHVVSIRRSGSKVVNSDELLDWIHKTLTDMSKIQTERTEDAAKYILLGSLADMQKSIHTLDDMDSHVYECSLKLLKKAERTRLDFVLNEFAEIKNWSRAALENLKSSNAMFWNWLQPSNITLFYAIQSYSLSKIANRVLKCFNTRWFIRLEN